MKKIDRVLKQLGELYEFNKRIQRFKVVKDRGKGAEISEERSGGDVPADRPKPGGSY